MTVYTFAIIFIQYVVNLQLISITLYLPIFIRFFIVSTILVNFRVYRPRIITTRKKHNSYTIIFKVVQEVSLDSIYSNILNFRVNERCLNSMSRAKVRKVLMAIVQQILILLSLSKSYVLKYLTVIKSLGLQRRSPMNIW